MVFKDREEAGRKLAQELAVLQGKEAVVYALPRGGVAVGFEVAKALRIPLDIILARKVGHPLNPEYAVCAVTDQGDSFCNEFEKALIDPAWLKREIEKERREALRRKKAYLGGVKLIEAKDKTAILVDDGAATGLTMLAAIHSVKKSSPKEIIVALPVAPHDTVEILRKQADRVVVLEDAKTFLGAVGAYYQNFPQVSDQEVVGLLRSTSWFQGRSSRPAIGTR